jgi:hypothetical protein
MGGFQNKENKRRDLFPGKYIRESGEDPMDICGVLNVEKPPLKQIMNHFFDH